MLQPMSVSLNPVLHAVSRASSVTSFVKKLRGMAVSIFYYFQGLIRDDVM